MMFSPAIQALLAKIPKVYFVIMVIGVLLLQLGSIDLSAQDILPSWLQGYGLQMIIVGVVLEAIWVFQLIKALRRP